MTNRTPSRLFIKVERPDLAEVELRTNYINPAAIAQVIKNQKGNSFHVHIYWMGKNNPTDLEGEAAKAFLQAFEGAK
ncbi:hypothetical protein Lepto7376_3699 [[Leptolyngbya] sp. PCC 7376]|uniref:hypothetical protein n=1 Tax=[Leptolyngbya] sp. PCC 7376 TaxID=111781 RepID=UPI00029F287A|nr:hypothetical protein [[Leptolyngbya] sp. PCC 7376]AFY39875.1 hypothetical protein Lepto7376_3699 [[Leptolyngbya] sp. PCC 7376]